MHLIGAGHDPKTVDDLTGHTDPLLTLMIHTHIQDESRKRAALTASELVNPGAKLDTKGKIRPTPKKLVGVS